MEAPANRLRDFAARLRPGALKKRFQKWIKKNPSRAKAFKRLAATRRRGPRPKIRTLKAEYRSKGLDREPDTFVLYRILGNDLYPRHKPGQTRENLAFLLEHEPQLECCEKRWVVNRIFDPEQEAAAIRLLRDHGQTYLHLPFDWDAYARAGWDRAGFPEGASLQSETFSQLKEPQRTRAETKARRLKNLYVMNNNGARNVALREGRTVAKWVLPWDGNCFLTSNAWEHIRAAVTRRPHFKYFIVPMTRVAHNGLLLEPNFVPQGGEEPQILFRRDASEEFDEAHPYGRRPKVELFWRLGVPGDWDTWHDDPWDLPRPQHAAEAGQFGRAGWVARLGSGHAHLEATGDAIRTDRGRARVQAIHETVDRLDRQVISRHLKSRPLMSYRDGNLEELKRGGATGVSRLVERLRNEAEAALQRGPYSVMDKTTVGPSGDPHDYWHPAPYWWPNPDTPDGLPYVNRDGYRVPGTDLHETGSEQYDRTSLQNLFDDTTVLALAWSVTARPEYAEHGSRLIRRWFVERETRMNPHLRYAQVQRGRHNDEGTGQGIIEARDLYFFLDAVRLLERSKIFSEEDGRGFAEWLRAYLLWLLDSPQGRHECRAPNNHATFYDLQLAAVASYLGDADILASTFRRAGERLFTQIEDDGRQPFELGRSNAEHYCSFNLQAWISLAELAGKCGTDLWREGDSKGPRLKAALEWFLCFYDGREWPFPQNQTFDRARFLPLYYAYRDHYGELPGFEDIPERFACEPILSPHYAIKPFWVLG